MEDPARPRSPNDRIAHAVARINAAMMRVSQAQEVLTEAKERLALGRLAREQARTQDSDDSPAHTDLTNATETP
jgi:hypothetical protein